MNNDLRAESIVAILFDYEYVFSRLDIKAKHCTCKHWETVCSSQCHLDMISLVEYLARI